MAGGTGGDGAPPLQGYRKFLRGPMGASAPIMGTGRRIAAEYPGTIGWSTGYRRRGVVTPPYGSGVGLRASEVPPGNPSVTAKGRDCSLCTREPLGFRRLRAAGTGRWTSAGRGELGLVLFSGFV